MKEYEKFINYLKIKNSPLLPLTRTQYEFIKFLFKEENIKELSKTGDSPKIFNAVWKYIKGI